jgi:hypothetical protein
MVLYDRGHVLARSDTSGRQRRNRGERRSLTSTARMSRGGRRTAAGMITRDEARRIAVNVAKPPDRRIFRNGSINSPFGTNVLAQALTAVAR